MEITASMVKALREATGAGMMECKKALSETGGDVEAAKKVLRERGLAGVKGRAGRSANDGLVEVYLHAPDASLPAKLGVLIELNCETDFVAKTPDFRKLARDIAMHIAAANPAYVTGEEIPEDVLEAEKAIYAKQAEDKPAGVVERMVEGKLKDFRKQFVLLEQEWVRDPSTTIGAMIDSASAKMGEKVAIRRFARFRVGAESA
ncbi:MAG: translation elongation factor Ts [Actinomycetota bacterium]